LLHAAAIAARCCHLLRAAAIAARCCHFSVAGIPDDCAKDSNERGEAQWRYFPRLD
jgi:hypothetical protein